MARPTDPADTLHSGIAFYAVNDCSRARQKVNYSQRLLVAVVVWVVVVIVTVVYLVAGQPVR